MSSIDLTPLFSDIQLSKSILGVFNAGDSPTKILADLLRFPILETVLHCPNYKKAVGKLSIRKKDIEQFGLKDNQKFKVILVPIKEGEK